MGADGGEIKIYISTIFRNITFGRSTRAWRRHYVRLAQDPKGEKIASKHRTPFALNYKAQNVLSLPIPNLNIL